VAFEPYTPDELGRKIAERRKLVTLAKAIRERPRSEGFFADASSPLGSGEMTGVELFCNPTVPAHQYCATSFCPFPAEPGQRRFQALAGAVVVLTLMLPAVSLAVTDEEIGQQIRAACSKITPVEGKVVFGEFATASKEARSVAWGAFAAGTGSIGWFKNATTSETVTVACNNAVTTVSWERLKGKNASMVLDGPRDRKEWINKTFPIENGYCLYGHLLGEYKFQAEPRAEAAGGVLKGLVGVTQVVSLHCLGEEMMNGHKCWKMEAVQPGSSQRTFLWLASELGGVIVKQETRDKKGRLLSTLENLAFQEVGGVVVPKETVIRSIGSSGERTTVAVLVECSTTTLESLWAKVAAPPPDNTVIYNMLWSSVYLRKSAQ
jgi:hypothetical protein